MNFTVDLVDWCALAPALDNRAQWVQWAQAPYGRIDATSPMAKCEHLPMMQARRLTLGSRQAVECGLAMLKQHPQIDAFVYASRHGELERNLRVQTAIVTGEDVSPTDFTMSVHNAAVGSVTIAAKAAIPSTSVVAGLDSFQQGLIEALAFLSDGYEQVLLVDFDGPLPDFYLPHVPEDTPSFPYAVALLLQKGAGLSCKIEKVEEGEESKKGGGKVQPTLPQSMQFLFHYLKGKYAFTLQGQDKRWVWKQALSH